MSTGRARPQGRVEALRRAHRRSESTLDTGADLCLTWWYANRTDGEDYGMDGGGVWLTVGEAAGQLGISKEALRKRIRRGSVQAERRGNGTWRVQLPRGPGAGDDERRALLAAKDETIRHLAEQLDAERRANEENRRIIAALTARIPAIEPPPEATEPPSEATASAAAEEPFTGTREYAVSEAEPTPQPGRVGPQTEVEGPQEGAERVSWWRRIFGG